MKKKILTFAAAGCMALLMTTTAFAGQWQQNASGWWYDNGDGTYPTQCWKWIDGDGDGIAECYYFDKDGIMLAGVTTPDGNQVNESGKWILEGVIQTKSAESVQNQSEEFVTLTPFGTKYFISIPDSITDAAGNTYSKVFTINCRKDRGSCYCMYDNKGYTRVRADKITLAKGSVGEIAGAVIVDVMDARTDKKLGSVTVTPETTDASLDVDVAGRDRIKITARVIGDQGDSAYVVMDHLRFEK